MDVINILFLKIKKYWHHFLIYISHRLKFIIFTICIILFFICSIFFWFNKVNYVVLYDNLSDTDGKWIVSKLQDMHISYRFNNSYKTLLVPEDKLNELHFYLLNNQDIKQKTDGFELLDKEKFGISQFHEYINYNRGLEGELSNTLERIFPIQHARVHLVCKHDTDFFREKQVPSASIVLTLFPNTQLNTEQIDAITLLVSGSIPDLSTDHVVVVNQYGNVLNKFTLNQNKFFKKNQYKKINFLEQYLCDRINQLLVPMYGSKNVIVRVTAGVEFDNTIINNSNVDHLHVTSSYPKKILENILDIIPYKNNILDNSLKQSFLELSVMKMLRKSCTKQGLKNNLFYKNFLLNKQFIYLNHSIIPNKKNFSDNVKKKIIDSNTRYVNDLVFFPGFKNSDIRNLTITILINYKQNDLGVFVPLSIRELQDVEKLVKLAINFSDSRGDRINIINNMFATVDTNLHHQNHYLNIKFNLYYMLVIFFGMLIFILIFFLFIKDNRINNNKKNFLKSSNNTEARLKNSFNKNLNKLNLKTDNTLNKHDVPIKNDIFSKNPKIIEKIIRYWMNKK
ncbi:flagellar basal-body MS-ring/collar protein FliF [Buchnera aphidicola]|uniref:Flagellar M-ring protein n=1 Tax=Buchnera aphidicola (Cinara laricifoliae) TaxID=2518977 RepID=A0A451DB31_9GAMM|nr:flagellar basal-body MS-ring/collar protein FliF [Buchnera aphidicola]VFP83514.1 Flagellar M-ring protein [Buchnera aphidicola (Cinara laricifoliae)]